MENGEWRKGEGKSKIQNTKDKKRIKTKE